MIINILIMKKYDEDVLVKVYKLVDPDDESETPRYIGITIKSLQVRLTHHCGKNENKTRTHRTNWVKSLLECGKRPKIILIEEVVGWKNACEREIYWIQFYKDIGLKLCNGTLGGDGTLGATLTEEHKAAISKAQTGKIVSEKTRKKLSELNAGENHPLWGKNLPEEVKEKMRKPKSPDAVANISAAKVGEKNPMFGKTGELAGHYGKTHSEESRAKIKAARAKQVIIVTQIQCPHCGKIGGNNNMHRWHFDNCKFKTE